MLTFMYRKTGAAAYISHIDTLRAIIRTLRRAEIPVEYSKGFNPHMNLYMSPPIVLGVESLSEFCTVDTDIEAEKFFDAFNRCCIKGMECLAAVKVSKNPNVAAAACAAEYEISGCNINTEDIINKKEFLINGIKNGIAVVKDCKQDIIRLEKTESKVKALLKFGNRKNFRIDTFLKACGCEGAEVLKTGMFCDYKGRMLSAMDYILLFKA
jgi:radical SAM-linked protein